MRAIAISIVGMGFLCAATPAAAVRPEDKAWIQVGAFSPKIDTEIRVDVTNLDIEGTEVDFERDLNLDDRKGVPKIDAGIRLGKRFRLEADFLTLKRSGHTALERTITIDDTQFPLATEVDSELQTKIYRVAAGYSFIRNDKAEFGVSVGAHITKVKAEVAATVLLPGDTAFRSERRDVSAPLPNVGLFGAVVLSKVFSIDGRMEAFALKVGDYKGRLIDARLGVSARLHKNIGVGLAYRRASYRLEVNKSDWDGRFEYRYSGPMAHLELAF